MTLKIKLFLADSYSLFVEGLSVILSTNEKFEIAGLASNHQELQTGLKNCQPDVLIIDYNLLFPGGISFIQDLRGSYHGKILVLHDATNLGQLQKIQFETDGFLSKISNSTELYHKILEIFRCGKNNPTLRKRYVYSITPLQEELIRQYRLTNREVEVIKLIALEFSSNEIARKLCVSEFTVDTYRKNITRKLNARNVASIVNFAHRWELI